jgi:hypothetical protein
MRTVIPVTPAPPRKGMCITRFSVVVFAGLVLILTGGCNKTTSSAPSSGSATTASTATPSAGFAPSSLVSPSASAMPRTDEDSIQAAVQQHLAANSNINMAAMDMKVIQTSINGDQAQADVEFRLKQGGTTMQMTYSLVRHAGGWLVTNSHPTGGQFAHPPMDRNHSATAAGAPPNSGSPAMPDVHDFFKNAPSAKTSRDAQ